MPFIFSGQKNSDVLYPSSSSNIIYDKHEEHKDRIPLGGAREIEPLENEKSYPLSVLEYKIIRKEIPSHMLDNNQSLALSIALSFLLSAIGYYSNVSFYISNKATITINWPAIIWFIIFCSISAAMVVVFIVLKFCTDDKNGPFISLEEKIKTTLEIK